MTTNSQLERLQTAIRERAEALADSHLKAAQQQQHEIIAQSNARLSKLHQSNTELAKALAEQQYRRQVQASELKMQADLDQLRWNLVQLVSSKLQQHLKQLSQQQEVYIGLLKQYLKILAPQFEEQHLVVEVNQHDYTLITPQWEAMVNECVIDKICQLKVSKQPITGGILVHNQADRIRIDYTFEGLIASLEDELYQIISAQLFASATSSRNI